MLGSPFLSNAQTAKAKLEFQVDTIELGRIVPLHLEIKHHVDVVVRLPEKEIAFKPYELVNYEPALSKIDGSTSIQSGTYYIRSFEVAPKQSITLPYYTIHGKDTSLSLVSSDSVIFAARIKEVTPYLPFQFNAGVFDLKVPLNYLLIAFGVLGAGLLGFLMYRLLKKPVQRIQVMQAIRTHWNQTKQALMELNQKMDESPETWWAKFNDIWKSYLEHGAEQPIRSLTTTELIENIEHISPHPEFHSHFIQTSKLGDQAMYAGIAVNRSDQTFSLSQMHDMLERIYKDRIKAAQAMFNESKKK